MVLLLAGAHPNLVDTRGNTALHCAAMGRGGGFMYDLDTHHDYNDVDEDAKGGDEEGTPSPASNVSPHDQMATLEAKWSRQCGHLVKEYGRAAAFHLCLDKASARGKDASPPGQSQPAKADATAGSGDTAVKSITSVLDATFLEITRPSAIAAPVMGREGALWARNDVGMSALHICAAGDNTGEWWSLCVVMNVENAHCDIAIMMALSTMAWYRCPC